MFQLGKMYLFGALFKGLGYRKFYKTLLTLGGLGPCPVINFGNAVEQRALSYGCGSKPTGSHFGVGAPPILEPVFVGIGMFTEGQRPGSANSATAKP